ncbi:MAG TPA: hypothetical protein PLU35_12400 [Phycisphaerales bacterium]|nr:hypothetical protein [Phycisphaerales bacterium]
MRIKGVNFFEQHVEKLVLGVVSLVLLGVLTVQFVVEPNVVKIGSSEYPPHQRFLPAENEANALLARMGDPSPEVPDVREQSLRERFAARIEGSVAPRSRFSLSTPGAEIQGVEDVPGAETIMAMPAIPPVNGVVAAPYLATIDPFEWVGSPELRPFLPAEQPFDKAAVSVEGVFSGRALREALLHDPDGPEGPQRPLPPGWWRDNFEVLGIELQREERTPTGEWSNVAEITSIPGRLDLVKEVRSERPNAAELRHIVEDARAAMREIVQPDYLRTIAGPAWVRPSEAAAALGMTEEAQEIARVKSQIAALDERIAGLDRAIEDQRGPGGREPRAPDPARRGEPQPGQRDATTDANVRRLQAQREGVVRQREIQVKRLQDLGGTPDDPGRDQAARTSVARLLENAELRVWAHDVTARPGSVVRYRMRLVLNNPVYGKTSLSEDQQSLAGDPLLAGPWSDWAAPVEVPAEQYFFITSAGEGDALGRGPRASADLFRFYYGYWRRARTTLEPGDSIRGTAQLPEGLLLWDMDKLSSAVQQQVTRPGEEWRPEGERFEPPREEGRRAAQPAGETQAGAPAAIPEHATAAPKTLALSADVMLLDVARLPGGVDAGLTGARRQAFQAVLRDQGGTILVRNPDDDRATAVYRGLSASAEEGRTQGQTPPEPEPADRRPAPQPREREAPRDRPDSGGGKQGGGGGGGG